MKRSVLGFLILATICGCVRQYVEPDSTVGSKIRFRMLDPNQWAVVQVFDNDNCSNGRALGVLMHSSKRGMHDLKELKSESSRDMLGTNSDAIRQGMEFERVVSNHVFSVKYTPSAPALESCPLTISAPLQPGHQYEATISIGQNKCAVSVDELSLNEGELVREPLAGVKRVSECTQLF